ncbi:MAG TPA: 16S rRNA (adenine(1518)-N(6)/adenine(1519)-N(6))-dimethyltransferase RsmA [Woeseiaceae bacterium]|nr:16S rRNA (adenine(1518)-N(6)/adenine(1519)-N(6))-dimethyltransferase RsmA [Woeseiaceae bacterium]
MTAPLRARKRFGQHFLTSPDVIHRIVGAIAPRAGDTLVEIGPGRGAITEPLAKSGATLHAVELDRDLARRLEERFAGAANVSIVQADALRFDFASLGAKLRVVGNLPYNISTPLLFHMLEFSDAIEDLHFMLQKEVVERMAASPGTKDYGRLTIMLGCRMTVEPLFDVPADAFTPPPKVTSAVIRLRPRPAAEIAIENVAVLSKLVAQAFSQRRKTLRNALRAVAAPEALEAVGIDPGSRAETVPVATWVALANQLAAVR